MIILGIETSCDETALSIIDAEGSAKKPSFRVFANTVLSQVKIHKKYGGVFPSLAKREHAKNLIPLFEKTLKEAGYLSEKLKARNERPKLKKEKTVEEILAREPELYKRFIKFIGTIEKPPIDFIAVTQGPGLEPTLWVGINFAKALALVWHIPVIPLNHMEGHIASVLIDKIDESKGEKSKVKIKFPILALLISGGHTELVFAKKWHEYEVLGETRDDAVGEAYDKVGRMLGIPYPAGPEISRLADEGRKGRGPAFKFPRPMIRSGNLDFSFSGLKTAVLYTLKKIPELTPEIKRAVASEFENAVVEVFVSKVLKALKKYPAKTLIIGGGVSANKKIREAFKDFAKKNNLSLLIPRKDLSTDNALMIAMAGFIKISLNPGAAFGEGRDIEALGNLRLS